MHEMLENNQVTIEGEISSTFTYDHETYGEGIYTFELKSPRYSSNDDYIIISVSERLIDVTKEQKGKLVRVKGQFRSFNKTVADKRKLILTVFAREVEYIDNIVPGKDSNSILLEGYVCKEPLYRATPLGREITDLLLAVNRPYRKTDYIPCICWGRNATFSGKLDVGTMVQIEGRVQSREYYKRISETKMEARIAYEVSVSRIVVIERSKENGQE